MKRIFVIITILILTSSISFAQDNESLYLRYPALSPDGKTICFACKGDLWLVPSSGGEATRLTVHPADDIMPQFSPDGSKILFSSNRYNNYDLFAIPITGGEPKRLTVYTGSDYATGWTPDGDTAIFYSYRQFNYDIFKVSMNAETPVALTGGHWDAEYFGKITPDGKKLIYNNGTGLSRWWKASFAGNTNTDVWIIDRTSEKFSLQRVTSIDGHDIWPIYNQKAGTIYFAANRDGQANLWKKDLSTDLESRVTNFKDDGVQWINSDPQMKHLVFEQGFSIWYYDPSTDNPRKVDIKLASDYKSNPVKEFTFRGNIDTYDISPDSKLAAVIIRGELFVIPTEKPKYARRLTFTSQRENHPCFGADSKTIYYSSDRNGNYDIFKYDLPSKTETQLTSSDENETKPLVSPDGIKLVYYRGLSKIMLYDLEKEREIDSVEGMFIDLAIEPDIEYDFSPDSRYLVMTMAMETYETNIWVTDFKSAPINISHLTDYNYRPRFSDDGKLIYFSSWVDNLIQTKKIELANKPFEFEEDRLDSLFSADQNTEKTDKDKSDKKAKIEPVKIEFDDIYKRVGRAFRLSASNTSPELTPDGEKYLFIANILGKSEIWSVNADSDDPGLTQLTHSGNGKSELEISADSKYVYYLENGKLNRLDFDKKESEGLDFTANMDIIVDQENRQKFQETWSMLNQYFYDRDFHGVDWKSVKAKYSPLIDGLETETEFRDVILEMMGELKASHIYIYPGKSGVRRENSSPWYGFYFNNDELEKTDRYKIDLVLPNSPAAKASTPLKSGDYILAINGKQLSKSTNIYHLLNGLVGKKTIFTVTEKPGGKQYKVAIKGTQFTEINALADDYWVETRRAMVDSLSAGRLAYLHIRRMNNECLEKFKLELVNLTEGKEGVVLDVRHNGGGNIAVHLLGILIKEPYILRNFVGFPPTSENKMRSKALEKPSILLIDNGSGSNSEIFAEGYRRLKLGKIVGERTAGGVIGTASFRLIDGTRIRRPSWGCFSIDHKDLELEPRYPDITVEMHLDDVLKGRDPQLEKAVDELLKEL